MLEVIKNALPFLLGEYKMTDTALRWSGLLLAIGAIAQGVGSAAIILSSSAGNQSQPQLFYILLVTSSMLLLLSFPGMYAIQAKAAGWLGLAGYMLLQIGILLPIVAVSPHLRFPSYNPPGGENAIDGLLAIAFMLGLLLTGLAILRASVFPRWAGILVLISAFGFFFAFFIAETLPNAIGQVGDAFFSILQAIGFAWIGANMLKRRLVWSTEAVSNG